MKAFAIVIFLILSHVALAETMRPTAESALRRVFGESITIRTTNIAIDSNLTNRIYAKSGGVIRGKILAYTALAHDTIVGYGFVDDVKGKAQPITYITLFRPD